VVEGEVVTEQKVAVREGDQGIRVTKEVHQLLLTIQYRRKMAGESVSFNDIIRRALDGEVLEWLRSQVTP
jgi:hypothetical protein